MSRRGVTSLLCNRQCLSSCINHLPSTDPDKRTTRGLHHLFIQWTCATDTETRRRGEIEAGGGEEIEGGRRRGDRDGRREEIEGERRGDRGGERRGDRGGERRGDRDGRREEKR